MAANPPTVLGIDDAAQMRRFRRATLTVNGTTLVRSAGRVVTRRHLLQEGWGLAIPRPVITCRCIWGNDGRNWKPTRPARVIR